MSETSSVVTADHFRYLAARTRREDPFLSDLKREAQVAGLPPISIAPEQASLMQILLKLARAREVIELSLAIMEQRAPRTELQKTRSKKSLE